MGGHLDHVVMIRKKFEKGKCLVRLLGISLWLGLFDYNRR